ncbi:hypothetical protein RchiOBHm_Chr5g0020041 [Rosa chinensis]|uniref:Uncharacterized protein n=1 Tax=Rosa chinensis TaxID=74649 RepID=A0A2P6Q750_ROSCH|nr:hypothetical protein RchiOBHm_Chr5g0020041 [Rosa chinensis]
MQALAKTLIIFFSSHLTEATWSSRLVYWFLTRRRRSLSPSRFQGGSTPHLSIWSRDEGVH